MNQEIKQIIHNRNHSRSIIEELDGLFNKKKQQQLITNGELKTIKQHQYLDQNIDYSHRRQQSQQPLNRNICDYDVEEFLPSKFQQPKLKLNLEILNDKFKNRKLLIKKDFACQSEIKQMKFCQFNIYQYKPKDKIQIYEFESELPSTYSVIQATLKEENNDEKYADSLYQVGGYYQNVIDYKQSSKEKYTSRSNKINNFQNQTNSPNQIYSPDQNKITQTAEFCSSLHTFQQSSVKDRMEQLLSDKKTANLDYSISDDSLNDINQEEFEYLQKMNFKKNESLSSSSQNDYELYQYNDQQNNNKLIDYNEKILQKSQIKHINKNSSENQNPNLYNQTTSDSIHKIQNEQFKFEFEDMSGSQLIQKYGFQVDQNLQSNNQFYQNLLAYNQNQQQKNFGKIKRVLTEIKQL